MKRLSELLDVVADDDSFVMLRVRSSVRHSEEDGLALQMKGFDGRESYIRISKAKLDRSATAITFWWSGREPENTQTWIYGEQYVSPNPLAKKVMAELKEALADFGIAGVSL